MSISSRVSELRKNNGRYFIQAEKELSGNGIDLFKIGEEGVPNVDEFVIENIQQDGILDFYGS